MRTFINLFYSHSIVTRVLLLCRKTTLIILSCDETILKIGTYSYALISPFTPTVLVICQNTKTLPYFFV